ncbi:Detected protein of unknown function [Hibiscus syriacus]|uniref:NAB domain-containing protein n=1 Tax=Hibiscus syriacus TaxID=106335 RepID=A0A6A3AHL1_HIBSY|nr:Detected protein of unknown function [Hibiscus syriacus]
MLQRAANNAYSWWWASHIRTKQSKWMEQSLQDMEEKVKVVLKLIEEDGDSFARRAEMYYKKRPELINFVEESYRAYRALAERYNHLSTDLQNANSTIASIFPEQFQFAMEYEDESGSPKSAKKSWEISKGGYIPYVLDNTKGFVPHIAENSKGDVPTVPKVPKPTVGDVKGLAASGIKRKQQKIISPKGSIHWIPKSGLSIHEGLDAIHRLQKRILELQTEKEFARSTHECAMVKYWELDNEIQEIHEQLCSLEDEFGEGQAIADDEARIVMEVTALKSCRDTLAQLEDKQVRSAKEAQVEKKRIVVSRKKLDALKKLQLNQEKFKRLEQETGENDDVQKRKEIESLREKIKQQFEVFFSGSLSVTEMAEKIDELVKNVINLKSAVASQSLLVVRLRTEIDILQSRIEVLEDDKDTLIDGKNDVKKKIREMEEKLNEILELSQSFEDQNNSLQTHFTEAHCSLDHLSEKVLSIKEKFEKDQSSSMAFESSNEKAIKGGEKKLKMVKAGMELKENSLANVESEKESAEEENNNGSKDLQAAKPGIVMMSTSLPKDSQETREKLDHNDGFTNCGNEKLEGNDNNNLDLKEHESVATSTNEGGVISHENSKPSEKREDLKAVGNVDPGACLPGANNIDKLGSKEHKMEDKEKNLLMEYSLMLRNKDTEKKLKEVKANNQGGMLEMMSQLKELNKSNAMKDELIRSLQEKLSLLQTGLGENNNADQNVEPRTVISEKTLIIETRDAEKEIQHYIPRGKHVQNSSENLSFEVSKIEAKRKQYGSISSKDTLQSDVKQLSEHLRQVHDELTVWTEKDESLREELKERFSSLCELQEEITMALTASAEDDEFKFRSDQAARFQGEILNMKQENIRVANELEAGLDNVTRLQLEITRNQAKLSGDEGLSGSKKCRSGGRVHRSDSRSGKVPLSAFIFGGKSKKQKSSILRRMNTRMTTVLLRSAHSSKF